MTYIDPNRLRSRIASELGMDGVPRDEAERVAENFYRTLLNDNPHWFKPEVIDVADFVESQLSTASDDIRGVGEEMIHRYRWDLADHEGNSKNEYYQGALFGSFYSLIAFARLWDDRPDFKRVQKVAPFVQE